MNARGRIEKMEGAARASGAVRFRVIVPPKVSREEWRRYVCERPGSGEPPRFTIDLDGAGGEGERHGAQG